MSADLQPRHQAESRTEMTEYVLPQHANALGNVFGGQVMAWVDLCGAICAQRHASNLCVTAFVDDMKFEDPVGIGQVIHLTAQVTATFRTSMEIEISVWGEEPTTRKRWVCVTARLTFVAIDKGRKPTPVPALVIDSETVRESQAAGVARRTERLAKKTPTTV
ncbi:MAG: acyl-CoA thioesterase [Polyangiaceae bacterium]|nr:acyl-CoA thioesterase [Polyangiaceae bacterium]